MRLQLLQWFRNLKSGVLVPDTIHSLTTDVTSTRFAFQCALSSISMHCCLHNSLTLDKAHFVLPLVASVILIVALFKRKAFYYQRKS